MKQTRKATCIAFLIIALLGGCLLFSAFSDCSGTMRFGAQFHLAQCSVQEMVPPAPAAFRQYDSVPARNTELFAIVPAFFSLFALKRNVKRENPSMAHRRKFLLPFLCWICYCRTVVYAPIYFTRAP